MYLEDKLVFLAGSAGLAGTSILQRILADYPTTKIRGSYYKHTKPFVKDSRIEYVYGDLRSVDECRKMIKGCDCAIMAAAYTGGAAVTTTSPWEHVKENLLLNTQMLEAFHREGIKRVVYIGSATLYQEFEGNIKEDELDLNKDPHHSHIGFGGVVRFTEKLCAFIHEKYKTEIIIVRAANIFGPYAKFDPQTSNFIPAIIRKAADKMDPFEVWGTPDVVRDVIYSEDFARAIAMIMDNEKITFDIFNIGSGRKTTVDEVVKWALKYAGHIPSEIRYLQDKPTTIKFRVLDSSKAKRILGWEPEHGVEEGIKKTTQWWFENKGRWKK